MSRKPPPSPEAIRAVSDAAISWAWISLAVFRGKEEYIPALEPAATELEDALAAVNPMVRRLSGGRGPRKVRPRLAK